MDNLIVFCTTAVMCFLCLYLQKRRYEDPKRFEQKIKELWLKGKSIEIDDGVNSIHIEVLYLLNQKQINKNFDLFFQNKIVDFCTQRKPIAIGEKEYFVIELTSYYEFLKNSALGLKVLNLVQQYELENSQQSMEM